MNATNYFETTDGAKIYYEDRGSGQPILLVHGWTCSSKFWQKNVPELATAFRIVTLDLRGHGNSSKVLTGHTIKQYAGDVRELIEHLDLVEAVLVGWSMAGPVALSYYEQYGGDTRVKALGLVDCAPFPFGRASWNNHSLRDYNYEAMHALFANYTADRRRFATTFANNMFKQQPSESDTLWVVEELMKTPTSIAQAAYSDFVMSDHARSLPAINVPVIVFAADSKIFPKGIAMGKAIAGEVPRGTLVPFENAGHILFYEQPHKFNAALIDFVRALSDGAPSPKALITDNKALR